MAEFDVIEAFTKDAHNCDGIKKALDAVAEAGKYGVDYGSDLKHGIFWNSVNST